VVGVLSGVDLAGGLDADGALSEGVSRLSVSVCEAKAAEHIKTEIIIRNKQRINVSVPHAMRLLSAPYMLSVIYTQLVRP
jgi:hypothetical protein